MRNPKRFMLAAGGVIACALLNTAAQADALTQLNLDYHNGAAASSYDGANALAVPGDYLYGQFTLNTSSVSGPDPFYDDYVFMVDSGAASSVTATVDLGTMLNIDDLDVKLYSVSNGYVYWAEGAAPSGVLAVYQATISSDANSTTATLANINLAAGTYVLQISGAAAGTSGGVYSGLLSIQPVPLPAAGWLLLTGLLGLGVIGRRQDATRNH